MGVIAEGIAAPSLASREAGASKYPTLSQKTLQIQQLYDRPEGHKEIAPYAHHDL